MHWRLINDAARSGPENMARDEFCLNHMLETGQPILRLYHWKGAVLSVGRNQKVERQIDLAACRALGIPLVRRMTGGRAVLHGSDLTYAVAAPTAGGRFAPGIMAIYREIAQVFLEFFRELGYAPQAKTYSGGERAELASAVCFSTPSAFEILVDGKKVVGSAQRLLPGGFLQHGSIPLEPQARALSRIFHGVEEEELRRQMTDLRAMGAWGRFNIEDVERRLAAAFAKVMQVQLEPDPWRPEEERRIAARLPTHAYLDNFGAMPAAGASD